MLFEELEKIKRSAVMASIVLAAAGFVLLVVPAAYVGYLGAACGFALLVAMGVQVLEFIGRRKSLMGYIRLSAAIAAGLLGLALLVFDGLFAAAAQWLVGTVPILLGAYLVYHALVFARRSGRRGWWVLLVLAALLLAFGSLVFWNPWMHDERAAMQVTGGALMYSAAVMGLSLVWIWPVGNAEGGAR